MLVMESIHLRGAYQNKYTFFYFPATSDAEKPDSVLSAPVLIPFKSLDCIVY